MTRRTSEVAFCCSAASLSARVRRAIVGLTCATEERLAAFARRRALGLIVLRRRAIARLPDALERGPMTSSGVVEGILPLV